MLEQILKLLYSLVSKYSAKPSSEPVMDSAIQTSPVLEQSVSNKLQDKQLEDSQLTRASLHLEEHQVETPPQVHKHLCRKRRGHYRKKRHTGPPKQNKRSLSDENSQPVKKCIKSKTVSKPLHERHDQNIPASQDTLSSDNQVPVNRERKASGAAGCFIDPLSCWSQDSSSSDFIEPILEKLTAESKVVTPEKIEYLWQFFDSDF